MPATNPRAPGRGGAEQPSGIPRGWGLGRRWRRGVVARGRPLPLPTNRRGVEAASRRWRRDGRYRHACALRLLWGLLS